MNDNKNNFLSIWNVASYYFEIYLDYYREIDIDLPNIATLIQNKILDLNDKFIKSGHDFFNQYPLYQETIDNANVIFSVAFNAIYRQLIIYDLLQCTLFLRKIYYKKFLRKSIDNYLQLYNIVELNCFENLVNKYIHMNCMKYDQDVRMERLYNLINTLENYDIVIKEDPMVILNDDLLHESTFELVSHDFASIFAYDISKDIDKVRLRK